MEFFDNAKCKGRGDLFFAPQRERGPGRLEREAKAKALCQTCEHRDACLEIGREEYGIWGGLTEEERGVK